MPHHATSHAVRASVQSPMRSTSFPRYSQRQNLWDRFCIFARSRALLQGGTGSFSIDKIDIHLENSIRYRDIPDVHVGTRRLKIECHGVHDLDTVNYIILRTHFLLLLFVAGARTNRRNSLMACDTTGLHFWILMWMKNPVMQIGHGAAP